MEVSLPYTLLDPDGGASEQAIDNAEVSLKYANFSLAERGLLLGGGLELGLPTGDDDKGIGSNNVLEVEPFVDFGYRCGRSQVVGFLAAGFPTNENGEDEADTEIGWNLSWLYQWTPRFSGLIEFEGLQIEGGGEDGTRSLTIAPGFKFAPLAGHDLRVGLSLAYPLTADREFQAQTLLSVFQHF